MEEMGIKAMICQHCSPLPSPFPVRQVVFFNTSYGLPALPPLQIFRRKRRIDLSLVLNSYFTRG